MEKVEYGWIWFKIVKPKQEKSRELNTKNSSKMAASNIRNKKIANGVVLSLKLKKYLLSIVHIAVLI